MGKLGEKHCCSKENSHKIGGFKRKSDAQIIQRYRCKTCQKSFSQATHDPACWQKKRHLNYKCMMMLSSNVSMQRIAIILNINPKTVAKKLVFLGELLRGKLNDQDYSQVPAMQFDELQTIEHTKCKPLSVAMAVSKFDRKILGFRVSIMPATGHLAAISRKKYGRRRDDRKKGLALLFQELQLKLRKNIDIESDECTYYDPMVKRYFPDSAYNQHKGEKGSVAGQGELKKVKRDPLFSINHTFAMLRANINRLIRKTWCSTKKIARLKDHLAIYAWVHNSKLTADT